MYQPGVSHVILYDPSSDVSVCRRGFLKSVSPSLNISTITPESFSFPEVITPQTVYTLSFGHAAYSQASPLLPTTVPSSQVFVSVGHSGFGLHVLNVQVEPLRFSTSPSQHVKVSVGHSGLTGQLGNSQLSPLRLSIVPSGQVNVSFVHVGFSGHAGKAQASPTLLRIVFLSGQVIVSLRQVLISVTYSHSATFVLLSHLHSIKV